MSGHFFFDAGQMPGINAGTVKTIGGGFAGKLHITTERKLIFQFFQHTTD